MRREITLLEARRRTRANEQVEVGVKRLDGVVDIRKPYISNAGIPCCEVQAFRELGALPEGTKFYAIEPDQPAPKYPDNWHQIDGQWYEMQGGITWERAIARLLSKCPVILVDGENAGLVILSAACQGAIYCPPLIGSGQLHAAKFITDPEARLAKRAEKEAKRKAYEAKKKDDEDIGGPAKPQETFEWVNKTYRVIRPCTAVEAFQLWNQGGLLSRRVGSGRHVPMAKNIDKLFAHGDGTDKWFLIEEVES